MIQFDVFNIKYECEDCVSTEILSEFLFIVLKIDLASIGDKYGYKSSSQFKV